MESPMVGTMMVFFSHTGNVGEMKLRLLLVGYDDSRSRRETVLTKRRDWNMVVAVCSNPKPSCLPHGRYRTLHTVHRPLHHDK